MALQMNFEKTVNGFTDPLICQDAYWKVTSLHGDKNSMGITVSVFNNNTKLHTASYSFVPDLNGSNFIAQAYEHLKTLPEFSGATDV